MNKPFYDDAARRKLRSTVLASGMGAGRADQVVDLACHASETAVDTLLDICARGPDFALKMVATQLALQLAMNRFRGVLDRTQDLARELGVTSATTEVSIPR